MSIYTSRDKDEVEETIAALENADTQSDLKKKIENALIELDEEIQGLEEQISDLKNERSEWEELEERLDALED